jgi:hypothetical protein
MCGGGGAGEINDSHYLTRPSQPGWDTLLGCVAPDNDPV